MSDFQDLTGSEFERVDLSGSRFSSVLLNGATLRHTELHQVRMLGVEVVDTVIEGEIRNLVINGVDVAPLIEAELDRRDPDRAKFRPTTPDGFRKAWDLNEWLWAATVERARRLDPERLHESVDHEWSFIQTLRHLAFASESWVGRVSSVTRARGIRSRCPGTRCRPPLECHMIGPPARRSTTHWPCATGRWRWFELCWTT